MVPEALIITYASFRGKGTTVTHLFATKKRLLPVICLGMKFSLVCLY